MIQGKELRDHLSIGTRTHMTIDDVALPNDYGVGRIDGYVVFVPGGLPGDEVFIEIVGKEKRFGYGRILSLEQPSRARTTPPCPYFERCGGCTLQNLSYDEQLLIKEKHLRESLKRIGSIDMGSVAMSSIAASPDIFFYRGKIELAFGLREGKHILGFRKRPSPMEEYTAEVFPITSCTVFSPILEKIIASFLEFTEKTGLKVYNPLTKSGFLRHLIVREAKSTGQIMCTLETSSGPMPDMRPLWQIVSKAVPQIRSLYHGINNGEGDFIRFDTCTHMAGERFIEETMGPFAMRIYPESFFQPNPKAAQNLIERLPSLISPISSGTLIGLYCGTGPFEIALSPYFKDVTGVDSLEANIACAIENCRINAITNCSFRAMSVEAMKSMKSHSPDFLFIDPPRTGVSASAMKTILAISPQQILYLSCNPSTLARDLKTLQKNNYEPKWVAPFDFFPHTSHLETLVHLRKKVF